MHSPHVHGWRSMAWTDIRETLDEDTPWRQGSVWLRDEKSYGMNVETHAYRVHHVIAHDHWTRMCHHGNARIQWYTYCIYGVACICSPDTHEFSYLGWRQAWMDVQKNSRHWKLPPHSTPHSWIYSRYVEIIYASRIIQHLNQDR